MHNNTFNQDNRDKFNLIAGRYNQIVKFYNVEEIAKENIAHFQKLLPSDFSLRYSIAAIYRFLIPQIFSDIEKVIYLDADTIVNLDIAELWRINIEDKIFAALPEIDNGLEMDWAQLCNDKIVKLENYLNSGVLLMNFKIFREQYEILYHGIKFISQNPKYYLFDQDILNYCFSEKYLKLPLKFNHFVKSLRHFGITTIEKNIYHYTDRTLYLNFQDVFNCLWFKYFEKTPYFNVDVVERFYGGVRQMYIWQKNFATQISAIMSGKERAFFVTPNNVDSIKKIFYVKDSEEIINAVSEESVRQMINSLKNSGGKKTFFIMVNYPLLRQILMQFGFVEGKDFLNAELFLSDAHGVPLDSHQFVKLM